MLRMLYKVNLYSTIVGSFLSVLLAIGSTALGAENTKDTSVKVSNSGTSSAHAQDVDLLPYVTNLQHRIKHAWLPPKGYEFKKVTVAFTVLQNGNFKNLRLQKSAGIVSVNEAALKAVRDTAPFGPLPEGAPKDIDIQFTFDYNPTNDAVKR